MTVVCGAWRTVGTLQTEVAWAREDDGQSWRDNARPASRGVTHTLTCSRGHSSSHCVCFHCAPTVQGPGPGAVHGREAPDLREEGRQGKRPWRPRGRGNPGQASGALPPTPGTPRYHRQGRCMTEGCPRGSRGQVGTGFVGKGRMASRDQGHRQAPGIPGRGCWLSSRPMSSDPAAGSMPGRGRRRQAPGSGQQAFPGWGCPGM